MTDLKTTKRFGESYGSYPVLRVHDLKGEEIGGRINGNLVAGKIPKAKILEQFKTATKTFVKSKTE